MCDARLTDVLPLAILIAGLRALSRPGLDTRRRSRLTIQLLLQDTMVIHDSWQSRPFLISLDLGLTHRLIEAGLEYDTLPVLRTFAPKLRALVLRHAANLTAHFVLLLRISRVFDRLALLEITSCPALDPVRDFAHT